MGSKVFFDVEWEGPVFQNGKPTSTVKGKRIPQDLNTYSCVSSAASDKAMGQLVPGLELKCSFHGLPPIDC
jgi:hypothetical protein